jgi:N4-gp56 family major capsid protein
MGAISTNKTDSSSSALENLLSPIVAEALFVAQERSIMRGLVRNYTMPMNSGKTLQVPKYGVQTAVDLTEGTDMTNTSADVQVNPGKSDLTVKEVGIMTTLTDYARNTSESDVVSDLGKIFGEAIAKKIDEDLIALFDGFSNTIGDGTTAMSAAVIAQSIATLRTNAVPATDLACVLHPQIAYDLKANITNTFANPAAGVIQNEAMASGYLGTLFGVPCFETNAFSNTGSAGDFKGAVFHRDALGLATMKDISIETQRDATLRADEVVATAVYAVGELHDSYGVELHYDSSIAG